MCLITVSLPLNKEQDPDTTRLLLSASPDPSRPELQVCVKTFPTFYRHFVCVLENGTLLQSPGFPLVFFVWSFRPQGSVETLELCFWHKPTHTQVVGNCSIDLPLPLIDTTKTGPESACLFIHSMSDIDKMTCSRSNTPFCRFQFSACLQMQHRWLYQDPHTA